MELWAPVAAIDLEDGTEDALEVEAYTVKWLVGGRVVRQYTVDSNVDHALFTSMSNELTLVVVTQQQVHTFGKGGRAETMGLPFAPDSVVACEKGVVFSHGHRLFLMSDPLHLLGLIVPSSTSTVSEKEKPFYFGSDNVNIAAFKETNGNGTTVSFYRIRFFAHTKHRLNRSAYPRSNKRQSSIIGVAKRRATSMAGLPDRSMSQTLLIDQGPVSEDAYASFQKEVVLTSLDRITLENTDSSISIFGQQFGEYQALYIFDKQSLKLRLCVWDDNDNRVANVTRTAFGIVDIVGFKIGSTRYPFTVLLNEDKEMELFSGFFNVKPLYLPEEDTWASTAKLVSSNSNSIVIEDDTTEKHRIELIADINDELVLHCFRLLSSLLLDPTSLVQWLLVYQSTRYQLDQDNAWEAFMATVCTCLFDLSKVDQKDPWLETARSIQENYLHLSDIQTSSASSVILLFHLCREEYTLDAHGDAFVDKLGRLLTYLTKWAGWTEWTPYYNQDESNISRTFDVPQIIETPPNVFNFLISCLASPRLVYPELALDIAHFPRSSIVMEIFNALSESQISSAGFIGLLSDLQLTPEKLSGLAIGVRLPVLEILSFLSTQPTKQIDLDTFRLLGRKDFVSTAVKTGTEAETTEGAEPVSVKDMRAISRNLEGGEIKLLPDPNEKQRLAITRLLFKEDRRFHEVVKLLQTSKVQVVSLPQPLDISDHAWLEMQSKLSQVVALRTMALAFGRAAIYYSTRAPLISERLEIPELDFNLTLAESRVTVMFDTDSLAQKTLTAGLFHQGVAAGLGISRDAKNITGSWIVFNKPASRDRWYVHAGLLYGLGINGHLKNLEEWHIYSYLGSKDVNISIALLIGLCASNLGNANSALTKVLSVHIPALLPSGSNDLNVVEDIQSAAILALGLLYKGTQHRRMTEILVLELQSNDKQRVPSYRHACGLALGFINVGKGRDLRGIVDIHVLEKLEKIVTLHEDTAIQSAVETSTVGAVMALMFIFMKSNNVAVASKLEAPASEELVSYIRPNLLLLRTVAYHLIMWDGIGHTKEWISSKIPPALFMDIFEIKKLNSDDLPFYNILGGLIISICLRYTGTNDQNAFNTVITYIDEFRRLTETENYEKLTEDQKVTHINLSHIQGSIVMAAALIVAGTGNITLLQRLRPLYGRVYRKHEGIIEPVLFNDFVAVTQAMGILFLGGGQYSLRTEPFDIACLATAVLPLLFARPNAILGQHHRFLWALAAEKRCLVVRHHETNEPIETSVTLELQDGTTTELRSPGLLPQIDTIERITLSDRRFFPFNLEMRTDSLVVNGFRQSKSLYVQENNNRANIGALIGLVEKEQNSHEQHRETVLIRKILDKMSRSPHKHSSYLFNLNLIFAFTDFWHSDIELKYLPRRDIQHLKINVWRAQRAERAQ